MTATNQPAESFAPIFTRTETDTYTNRTWYVRRRGRGGFLVCDGLTDKASFPFRSEKLDECIAWVESHISAEQLRRKVETVVARIREQKERDFDATCPGYRAKQIAWQDWRIRLYSNACDGLTDLAYTASMSARAAESRESWQDQARMDAERFAKLDKIYHGIVYAFDARIKDARRNRDAAAYIAALDAAAGVTAEVDGVRYGKPRP